LHTRNAAKIITYSVDSLRSRKTGDLLAWATPDCTIVNDSAIASIPVTSNGTGGSFARRVGWTRQRRAEAAAIGLARRYAIVRTNLVAGIADGRTANTCRIAD